MGAYHLRLLFVVAVEMWLSHSMVMTDNSLLQDQATANKVDIKLYNVKQSKFDAEAFKKHVASKLTEYCNHNLTTSSDCLLNTTSGRTVTFNASHVLLDEADYEQDGADLELSVAISYPVDALTLMPNTLVLPQQTLIDGLLEYQKSFREALGHDLIGVGDMTFSTQADRMTNSIVVPVFAVITVLLLIATLVIRRHYMNEEETERREKLKQMAKQQNAAYKVRPGPEFTERQASARFSKKPPRSSNRAKRTAEPGAYDNRGLTETQESHLHPIPHSAITLPPLESAPKVEKRKKKKKSSHKKHSKEQETSLNDDPMPRSSNGSQPETVVEVI